MRTLIVAKLAAVLSTVFLAFAALAPVPANAQQTLKVDVPFAFESGSTHFAPGTYKVHVDSARSMVRIEGDKSTAFQMTIPDATLKPSDINKLVFHRYGEQYILKQVWVAGSEIHQTTPKSKLEKELELAQQKQNQNGYLALLAIPR